MMRDAVVVVRWWPMRLFSAAAVSVLAASCGPDLGECNMDELGGSSDVATAAPNTGQVIIDRNCANSRCHSVDAKGNLRVGAPAELNFDVVPGNTSAEEISKAHEGTEVVHDNLDDMWGEIEEGSMPPAAPAGSGPLSATDKEIVRNWLACNAPVIAAPVTAAPVGADWTSIYEAFVGNGGLGCNVCHGETAAATSGNGFKLGDTGGACAAYARVVNAKSVTDSGSPPCKPTGQSLVVPMNANSSLLVNKLEGTQNCGQPMPFGLALGPTHPVVLDLREWIMAGAPKPDDCP